LLTSAMLLTAGAAPAQKCADIPVRFTFYETATVMKLDGTPTGGSVTSAIIGDGNDVYTNGPGVGASIKFCSGTYDAVLNLTVSKRKLTLRLPPALNGTNPPAPGSYTRNGVFNVLNILCRSTSEGAGCPNPGQPFMTRVVFGMDDMVGRDDYGLRFLPVLNPSTLPLAPYGSNVSSQVLRSDQNSPVATSPVLVLPQPYDCPQGLYPSWAVRGTLPNSATEPATLQAGTLFNKSIDTAVGQYSAPFEVQIQALQCFNPGY
jgi:hypothetical protein